MLTDPERLHRVRDRAAELDVDALLLTPGPDLRWLCGYEPLPLERLTCFVVPATGKPVEPYFLVPTLELPAAEAAGVTDLGVEVRGWHETEDPYRLAASRVSGSRRVAVANTMWAQHHVRLRDELPGAEIVLASQVLRELRMRKTTAEVDALRLAGQAIDRVHSRMAEFLRVGLTERQVGDLIARAIVEEGHARVDFLIVGSGPNGASPHHEVSDRVVGAGEPVVVDIGGTNAEGYCSDCTRMYVAGEEPPAQFEEYFAVVHAAQLAGVAHARAGVTAASVDAAARAVIDDAGYGEQFFHRLGHGIGVESHEDPYLVEGNDTVLQPGMTFSIEPGIYLRGQHGARIEDIVAIVPDGSRVERLNVTDRGYVGLPG